MSPKQHQIFAKRRGPSWGRIGLTLLAAVIIVIVGVLVTACVVGAITGPATSTLRSSTSKTAPASRRASARTFPAAEATRVATAGGSGSNVPPRPRTRSYRQ